MEQQEYLIVKMYGVPVDTYKNYDIFHVKPTGYVDLNGLTIIYLVNDDKEEVMELALFKPIHGYGLIVCGSLDYFDTSGDTEKFYKTFNKNKIEKIKTEKQLLEKIKETLKILNF